MTFGRSDFFFLLPLLRCLFPAGGSLSAGVAVPSFCRIPPDWTFDDALAFAILHSVSVRSLGFGRRLEQMSRIWNVVGRFGTDQAQWLPYWRN